MTRNLKRQQAEALQEMIRKQLQEQAKKREKAEKKKAREDKKAKKEEKGDK